MIAPATDPGLVEEHGRISRRLAEGLSWGAVTRCCLTIYREVVTAQARPLAIPAREFKLNAR